MRQLVYEKENSEFKPVKLRSKIDLVSYPARAEGLGKYGYLFPQARRSYKCPNAKTIAFLWGGFVRLAIDDIAVRNDYATPAAVHYGLRRASFIFIFGVLKKITIGL